MFRAKSTCRTWHPPGIPVTNEGIFSQKSKLHWPNLRSPWHPTFHPYCSSQSPFSNSPLKTPGMRVVILLGVRCRWGRLTCPTGKMTTWKDSSTFESSKVQAYCDLKVSWVANSEKKFLPHLRESWHEIHWVRLLVAWVVGGSKKKSWLLTKITGVDNCWVLGWPWYLVTGI